MSVEKDLSKLTRGILSDIIVHMKYAKYIPELKRRENWYELTYRNRQMHIDKFPELEEEIRAAYQFVFDKKVFPSMRSLQFGGKPIDINPTRIYNCCFIAADSWQVFHEALFCLLSGTGVGVSVQYHHVEQLPEIKKPNKKRNKRFLVGDSLEGWADAVKALVKSYFFGGSKINFDFSDIRPKGAKLITSGGKAPGPAPLKECLVQIESILDSKNDGDKLSTLEVHDIICYLADATLAGGIRRAAVISLFSIDDNEMATCKSGNWWETNPQRGRANNSAVVLRSRVTKEDFDNLFEKSKASGAGEPGIFFTNDRDAGTNPCVTEDTWVLTDSGSRQVKDLIGDDSFKIIVHGKSYKVLSKGFWKTGDKEVFEVKTNTGKRVKSTSNHMYQMQDDSWKELKDIKIGDKVKIHNHSGFDWSEFDQKSYDKGWLLGNMVGDGYISPTNGNICFWGEERNYLAGMAYEKIQHNLNVRSDMIIKDIKAVKSGESIISCVALKELAEEYGITKENKHNTSGIETQNSSMIKGYIQGLFDTDGTVLFSKAKGSSVRLCQINVSLLEGVQRMLNNFGIRSTVLFRQPAKVRSMPNGKGGYQDYNCQPSYELIISRESIVKFAQIIGLSSPKKSEKLQKIVDSYVKTPYRDNFVDTIVSIESKGVEAVYDITVDEVHCFDGNGFVLHNCCEISLKSMQFCNLCEVNVSDIDSQEDYEQRVKAATFIGTLQASYTNFHYLREQWKKNSEKDALLGVGMVGIASEKVLKMDMSKAAKVAKEENERVAKLIGINKAARITTCKPGGSVSLVAGTSSGIHAWHNDHYIRRIRVGKNEAIYTYLKENHPELIEDEFFRPHDTAVISVPVKAPENSITRKESAIEFLERVKKVYLEWVKAGHNSGTNTHNVSATISIKPNEWDEVQKWMWENRDCYSGLSLLPHFESDHTYKQPPFSDISEEEFNALASKLSEIDLDYVVEIEDNTDLKGELACGSGGCTVT